MLASLTTEVCQSLSRYESLNDINSQLCIFYSLSVRLTVCLSVRPSVCLSTVSAVSALLSCCSFTFYITYSCTLQIND